MSLSSPQPEQPDEQDQRVRDTLDELYADLAEVNAHQHLHEQEADQIRQQVLSLERDLAAQRDAAAKAGERATYEQLSEQLATLQRAWQALEQDPDADPLEEYQPDDSEPETNPDEKEQDDGDDPDGGPNGPLQAGGLRQGRAAPQDEQPEQARGRADAADADHEGPRGPGQGDR